MSNIRKYSFSAFIFAAALFVTSIANIFAAPFAPGNLVVCRVGDGFAALNAVATPVFLDEYTTGGVFVQTIALPTVDDGANQVFTASGSATSECLMTRSSDKQYLVLLGYHATVGTTSVAGTSTATITRLVARVAFDGIVNTSTSTTSFSAGNPRGVASNNGTDIWMSGSNTGIVYTTFGASGPGTIVSTTSTNNRSLYAYDNQLYGSTGSGSIRLATVGTGLPTTTGQTITNLPGFPTSGGSPYNFFFCDLTGAVPGIDTVYVADDGATVGIQKYSLVGGVWTLNGTSTGTGMRGLTGVVFDNRVDLYATGVAASNNTLVAFTDTAGYNARPTFAETSRMFGEALVPGPATTLTTAGTNRVFRGIAFAPLSGPVAAGVTVGGRISDVNGRGLGRVVVTLAGGELAQPRRAMTNPFGYYLFDDLTVGNTYVVTVGSKQYNFTPNTRVISLTDAVTDVDFVAVP